MAVTRIDPEVIKGYEQLDSTWRFIHQSDGQIVAEVIYNKTGQVYAKATGMDEADAAREALAQAQAGGGRPKNVADLVSENQQLREELERLKEQTEASSSVADVQLDSLDTSEILRLLKERGIDPPTGDRRKNEWKQAAIAMLRDADALMT